MNQVVIISDSHGLKNEIEEITARYPKAQFIHCGDSELEKSSPVLANYQIVQGNCDYLGEFPNDLIIDIADLRFFITHGHLYHVGHSPLSLIYRALEHGADIICYGHLHIAQAEKHDNQILINPGSVQSARKFNTESYCVIEWSTRLDIRVNFYQLNGKLVNEFPSERNFSI